MKIIEKKKPQTIIELRPEVANGKPYSLTANKRVVLVCDLKKKTFKVENYYWFHFKVWLSQVKSRLEKLGEGKE